MQPPPDPNDAAALEDPDKMEQTFPSRPPKLGLGSFADTGQPPYTVGMGTAPKVLMPVADETPGPQPAFHLKATITPVYRKNPKEPLEYEVVSGPTAHGEYKKMKSLPNSNIMTHIRPEPGTQKKQMLTIQPKEEDKDSDSEGGVVDPTTGRVMKSGGQVHVYGGSEPRLTRNIINKLLNPNVGAQAAADQRSVHGSSVVSSDSNLTGGQGGSARPTLVHAHGHRTIPHKRVSDRDYLRAHPPPKPKTKGKWWMCGTVEEETEDDMIAKAMQKELTLGKGKLVGARDDDEEEEELPPEKVQLDRGYSRLIPELVQEDDDTKPREYNWIIPTGEVKDKELEQAENNRKKSSGGGLFSSLCASKVYSSGDEKAVPLYFQGSQRLADFLEEPVQGMHWEESDDDDDKTDSDEGHVKPTIVYGGVEHAAPEYAGRLPPLTYLVSIIELHQYLAISGKRTPWFMEQNLDPHKNACFGPICLPFDPTFTGMPAPTFKSLDTHGQCVPTICPQLRSFFNYELPVIYDNKEICAEDAEEVPASPPMAPQGPVPEETPPQEAAAA